MGGRPTTWTHAGQKLKCKCALPPRAVSEQLHALPGLPRRLWRAPPPLPPRLCSAAVLCLQRTCRALTPSAELGLPQRGARRYLAGLWLPVAGALLRFWGGSATSVAAPKGVGFVLR